MHFSMETFKARSAAGNLHLPHPLLIWQRHRLYICKFTDKQRTELRLCFWFFLRGGLQEGTLYLKRQENNQLKEESVERNSEARTSNTKATHEEIPMEYTIYNIAAFQLEKNVIIRRSYHTQLESQCILTLP